MNNLLKLSDIVEVSNFANQQIWKIYYFPSSKFPKCYCKQLNVGVKNMVSRYGIASFVQRVCKYLSQKQYNNNYCYNGSFEFN